MYQLAEVGSHSGMQLQGKGDSLRITGFPTMYDSVSRALGGVTNYGLRS